MDSQNLEHIFSLSLQGLAGKAAREREFARRAHGASPYDEADLRPIAQAVKQRTYPREALSEILRRQNAAWGGSPETATAIQKLEDGAPCVMTGQQAGIFTGPLYTVFKALSAVAWARELGRVLGEPVIPVFWIAADDHDYAEIAHGAFPSQDGTINRFVLPRSLVGGPEHARVSHLALAGGISTWITETLALVPDGVERDAVVEAIRCAYVGGGTSLVDAFARLMTSWLGNLGLILVNPADTDLKRLTAPIIAEEIAHPERSQDAIEERNAFVRAEGYPPQVCSAPDATLLFLDDEPGSRRRVDYDLENGFTWRDGATLHPLADMEEILSKSPERFSPNALLRPVVGDSLFPTIVHIMGPAEIAYMAQARGLYQRHAIPMPAVASRARFTLIPTDIEELLNSEGYPLHDAFQPIDLWIHELVEREKQRLFAGEIDTCRAQLDATYEALARSVLPLLPGTVNAVSSARVKTQGLMNKLERKLDQGIRRSLGTRRPVLECLGGFLYPGGEPQERVYSVVPFLARYGEQFFPTILDAISPFEPSHIGVRVGPFGVSAPPSVSRRTPS